MKERKEAMQEIKDIIEKSGNNFHCEVVRFLRQEGWTVLVSPYYSDNITNKPREIDIIAERGYSVTASKTRSFDDPIGTLNVKLFIECKYINKPIVLWFDAKDKEKAVRRIMKDTRIRSPENTRINEHHYLKDDKVAKLFSSHPDKTLDNELIYKALNQSLNAMVYYRNESSIIPEEKRCPKILKTLNYPLIVSDSFQKLYKVAIGGNKEPSAINDNFQLEVNYAYLNKDKSDEREYFLIDIINFEKFNMFLKELEQKDIKIVKDILAWDWPKR